MPHATHKARRIQTSDVPHAPVRSPRRTGFARRVILAAAVSFTTLIIVSLYAASFRGRSEMRLSDVDDPRWSIFDADLLSRALPVKDELLRVRQTLTKLAGAGKTQAKAAVIMRAKIEAIAASNTSETPETPETSPAAKALGDRP